MKASDLDNTFATGGEHELRCAIELYGQPLLRYCHNILCDYFEAQDVVQMTFIKAYNKRKSFKSGTSLSAWLYRIAYTTCIDLLRKKKLLFFLPHIRVKSFIEQESEDTNFIRDDLKEALLTLSPEERALVFSRVIDEKSYTELEEIYHVSSPTLRKRYERAKRKLSKVLQETNSYYERLEGNKNEI
ncbi:MAG: RNA polymerase sigma factor [Tepidanaerobacteraceae bacterium]|nr:RNA polymerase sigma factor [Dysgonamonadaceae bacterium]MDD4570395.1 RNA polymerase sigma factor [Tepidanaerobacteraceae bacterium]